METGEWGNRAPRSVGEFSNGAKAGVNGASLRSSGEGVNGALAKK